MGLIVEALLENPLKSCPAQKRAMLDEMPPGSLGGTPGAAGKDGKSKYLFILVQLKKPTEVPIPPLGTCTKVNRPSSLISFSYFF